MSWAAVATVGAAVVGGAVAARGTKKAAQTQADSAQAGMDENARQFDVVQGLLEPYTQAGSRGMTQYEWLAGLQGDELQQSAISKLAGGSEFRNLSKQGEDAILQNASATGGLRGGNVQGALAGFRSNLLSSLIERQLGRYGGLAQMGQNSAARVGSAALTTGQANAALMQQQGAAMAGGQLAGANALASTVGNVGGILGARNWSAPQIGAPSVMDGGYAMGTGPAYDGTTLNGMFTPNRAGF